MNKREYNIFRKMKKEGKLTPQQEEKIYRELYPKSVMPSQPFPPAMEKGFYDHNDLSVLQFMPLPHIPYSTLLKTLDELLEHDKKREKDGFPRRIRIGKLIKPGKNKKGQVIIVPTTTEPKFYHDDSITEDGEGSTGGSGEGKEGEVIGEQQVQPQPGEGEGQGAGQGEGSDHDITSEAFDLGKMLTEKFELPNLKDKGRKRSFTKYTYDLTDRNKRFGQVLDKKATLRKVIETNILLGKISKDKPFSGEELLISPDDHIYRILSREKDFETQAVVFFIRDYSGSMEGKPSEVICTQHLLIYSWLMYQYSNNVQTRFIVHDTQAKEIKDFYNYYQSKVAGGTRVAPAFQLALKIIEDEQLYINNNIYIFYGTDGDDWDTDGKELTETLQKILGFANRTGITVAKNAWTPGKGNTTVEDTIEKSGLLKEKPNLIRLDSFSADEASENRLIEGIKKLIG